MLYERDYALQPGRLCPLYHGAEQPVRLRRDDHRPKPVSNERVKCDHCGTLCPFCPKYRDWATVMRTQTATPGPADRPYENPSLLTQAAHFARDIVAHVVAGAENVSAEELERRLAICRTCYYVDTSRGTMQCTACPRCTLSVKASWKEQRCPHPDGAKW
jgi:hypothetical protein